jgi:hypothetical protein
MSPRIKAAKVQTTQDIQGRIHISMSLGPRAIAVRLRAVTPFVSLCQLLHASECEPVRLLHETEDQYIDRLYSTQGGR